MNSISVAVEKILRQVQKKGDRALEFYTFKFDGIRLKARQFEVSRARMKKALGAISPDIRSSLVYAKRRVEAFHQAELATLRREWSLNLDGIRVGQRSYPLDSAGLYVPGGRYAYPSTVLMTAVPAKVAGVAEVVMVTPIKNLKDEILAAAYLAGVDRLFCVGGPAAVAALAYGTQTIPKVRKIVGPGNKFVTEAKRQVYGTVGIDGLAGPSEVAIWADESADPEKMAYNLMAQAEHDPDSRCYLYASNAKTLKAVRDRIEKGFLKQVRFQLLNKAERIAAAINELAPEHLILAVKNPARCVGLVRTAGAIFLGNDSPVPLGDYTAGPSHVLPTGQAGQFSSGLSVKDFLRTSSVIETAGPKSARAFESGRKIAEVEGLRYHAKTLALTKI